MNIISFVQQLEAIKQSAFVYIRETIKREGEIHIKADENGEYSDLVVPCTDYFSGDMSNIHVHTIKKDSLVGLDEWGNEEEVTTREWSDGTECYVADYVARYYGELK